MRRRLASWLAALAVVAPAAAGSGATADDLVRICGRFLEGSPPGAGAPEAPPPPGETAAGGLPQAPEPAAEGAPDDGCRTVRRCFAEARQKLADPPAAPGPGAAADDDVFCREVLALTARDLRARFARAEALLAARPRPAAGVSIAASEACLEFLRCVLRWREAGAEAGPEPAPPAADQPAGPRPAESWREDFARICGRTDEAAGLPRAELEALVRDSEALLERIGALGIPEAKIYVFRLEKCKAFFEYSLELLEARETRGGG